MDPLTQTLQLLRPEALIWKEAEFAGDWAVRFPAIRGVAFSWLAAGSCRLTLAGQEPTPLRQGDFILLASPASWMLSEGSPSNVLDGRIGHLGLDRFSARVGQQDGAAATRIAGGHFNFERANADLLTGLLPPVVHIRAADEGAGRLKALIGLIHDEAMGERPGRPFVLERLLEVLLTEVIRSSPAEPSETPPGLVAGLADPLVARALRAMHDEIGRAWTVAALAAAAGASRSVFAARFSQTVGMAPIDYLMRWRMALAKDVLKRGAAPLSEVAFACGYQSASAFSTAFSRIVGCPPGRYARESEAS